MYYYNSYYFESGDIALNICFNKIDQLQEEGLKVALMIKEFVDRRKRSIWHGLSYLKNF